MVAPNGCFYPLSAGKTFSTFTDSGRQESPAFKESGSRGVRPRAYFATRMLTDGLFLFQGTCPLWEFLIFSFVSSDVLCPFCALLIFCFASSLNGSPFFYAFCPFLNFF